MARISRPPLGEDFPATLAYSGPSPLKIPLPDISKQLLDYLDAVFKDRVDPAWRDFGDVREAMGTRRVIDHLRQLREEQENSHVPGGQ